MRGGGWIALRWPGSRSPPSSTTTIDDRLRQDLDRHAADVVVAFLTSG
jgi:hypothetical protein